MIWLPEVLYHSTLCERSFLSRGARRWCIKRSPPKRRWQPQKYPPPGAGFPSCRWVAAIAEGELSKQAKMNAVQRQPSLNSAMEDQGTQLLAVTMSS